MKTVTLILFSIVMFGFSGIAFAEHDPDKALNHSIILPPEIKEKIFDEFMEWCTPYYGEKCMEFEKKKTNSNHFVSTKTISFRSAV